MIESLIFFIISLLASIGGAICGIGGGVIIRPILDLCAVASVPAISFMSGCTVLSMSVYSVTSSLVSKKENLIKLYPAVPLSVGAAIGGLVGKELFSQACKVFENQNHVGAVQAGVLAVVTLGTLIYVIFKSKIKTLDVKNVIVAGIIGLLLGVISSFLGIGGGPINLIVLLFFFGMDTKAAAQNSLFIILFSQLASLISTLVTNTVPEFDVLSLVVMIIGGIFGGMIGRVFSRKMDEKAVDKLFLALIALIILMCVFNAVRYAIA